MMRWKSILFLLLTGILVCCSSNLYGRSINTRSLGCALVSGNLNYSDTEIIQKTIGSVSEKAVRKTKNFSHYMSLNEKGFTGKGFEALTVLKYQKKIGFQQLLPTAVLGDPHHVADLLLFDKRGKVVSEFQLKAGKKIAISALSDKRYDKCIILTHPETMESIQKELTQKIFQAQRRRVELSQKWKSVKNAIISGRLTDHVNSMVVPSRYESLKFTRKVKKIQYNELRKNIFDSSHVIKRINSLSAPRQFNILVGLGKKIAGDTASLLDVLLGVRRIWQAEGQFNQGILDYDLASYKKIIGMIQVGVGAISLAMIFTPEPITKIVALVAITVGIVVEVIDCWINYIQVKRNDMRKRLFQRISTRERVNAVRQLLLKNISQIEKIP
ncbi:MAG: hypothetical protein Q4C70_09450 [Planctomycetia bacterium]|nr:hypothetical protein [Planctomycetia bacterium]